MNRLIWKELVEQRYIPLAYAVLLTVILVVGDVMGNWIATHGGSSSDRMSMNNALGIFAGGLLITGLFPGCTTIANESAQGTLGFLSAIPTGRPKIWLSKVAAGVMVMAASAVAMLLTFLVVTVLEFHGGAFTAIEKLVPSNHLSLGLSVLLVIYGVLLFIYVSLYSYAISLFCSTITDRPLAAAGLALCIGLGLFIGLAWLPFAQSVALESGLTASIPGFLFASWFSFCKKSELNSLTRWITPWRAFSGIVIAVIAAFGIYFYLQFLAHLNIPFLSRPYYPIPMSFLPPNYKASLISYDVVYPRVKIGKRSVGLLVVGNSWQIDGKPVTLLSSSPSLTGQIERQNVLMSLGRRHEKRAMRTLYSVLYIYRPSLPYGDEVLTLNALSSDGTVIGAIHIQAHKPRGYFPPKHWFSELNRQGEYDPNGVPANPEAE